MHAVLRENDGDLILPFDMGEGKMCRDGNAEVR